MATVSGIVKDSSGNFAARMVRAYRKFDGAFAGEVVSNATTGAFSITTLDSTEHYVVEHDGVVTVGDPNWLKVALALHMDGANNSTVFTDEKGHTVTRTGTVKISDDAAAFGGSSALFDGTVSYLEANGADLAIGTSDFAITFWLTPLAPITSQKGLFGPITGGYLFIGMTSAAVFATPYAGTQVLKSITMVVGTRYYVEVTRSAGTLRIYVNGAAGSANASTAPFSNTTLRIGAYNALLADMPNVRIDDFKLVKAAGHTTDYTPPTTAFPHGTSFAGATENAQIFDNITPV